MAAVQTASTPTPLKGDFNQCSDLNEIDTRPYYDHRWRLRRKASREIMQHPMRSSMLDGPRGRYRGYHWCHVVFVRRESDTRYIWEKGSLFFWPPTPRANALCTKLFNENKLVRHRLIAPEIGTHWEPLVDIVLVDKYEVNYMAFDYDMPDEPYAVSWRLLEDYDLRDEWERERTFTAEQQLEAMQQFVDGPVYLRSPSLKEDGRYVVEYRGRRAFVTRRKIGLCALYKVEKGSYVCEPDINLISEVVWVNELWNRLRAEGKVVRRADQRRFWELGRVPWKLWEDVYVASETSVNMVVFGERTRWTKRGWRLVVESDANADGEDSGDDDVNDGNIQVVVVEWSLGGLSVRRVKGR